MLTLCNLFHRFSSAISMNSLSVILLWVSCMSNKILVIDLFTWISHWTINSHFSVWFFQVYCRFSPFLDLCVSFIKDTQIPPPPSSEWYWHIWHCIHSGSNLYNFLLELNLCGHVLWAMCWRVISVVGSGTWGLWSCLMQVTVSQEPRPSLESWCSSASISVGRFWDSSSVTPGSLDSIPIPWKARITFWLLSFYKQEDPWKGPPCEKECQELWFSIMLARLTSIFINRSNIVPSSPP